MSKKYQKFQEAVWDHYHTRGRHDLPWRKNLTPYKILVSEIMLQQTQVDRVIPKYKAFLKTFPSLKALARAKRQEVLQHWVGLGYNNRALRLQETAKIVDSRLPKSYEKLLALPGIGPYTAGAVCAFAFNTPIPIIETNIRTVFLYHFFKNKEHVPDGEILTLVEKTLDHNNPREWYWALMDYGAYLKKEHGNLARQSKSYTKQSKFDGSIRQIRGYIIKSLAHKDAVSLRTIHKETGRTKDDVMKAIDGLRKDGLISKNKETIKLK